MKLKKLKHKRYHVNKKILKAAQNKNFLKIKMEYNLRLQYNEFLYLRLTIKNKKVLHELLCYYY